MRNYKNIKAYQYSDSLVVQIYSMTRKFPKDELYGLTSQVRRSAVSVPTNIAEGASRKHKRDYLHFLYIARGSLAETEYLLKLSNQLNYLSDRDFKKTNSKVEESAKTLYGLINSVEKEVKPISKFVALILSLSVLHTSKFI